MAEKRYFVRYSTGKYDGEVNVQFDYLDEVEKLLSQHATNPEFTYEVVYGDLVEFEPVEIIKAYRAKRT